MPNNHLQTKSHVEVEGKLYQKRFTAKLSILLGSATIFPWKKIILCMYMKENRGKCAIKGIHPKLSE